MKLEQKKLLELKQLHSSKNAKIYQEIVAKKSHRQEIPSVSQLRESDLPAMRVLEKTQRSREAREEKAIEAILSS